MKMTVGKLKEVLAETNAPDDWVIRLALSKSDAPVYSGGDYLIAIGLENDIGTVFLYCEPQ